MLERANTATREVLARSVRGVGRLGANSLKERYQSPELSRDHTPTRSLGGAETGRSAMNGNDGPFACNGGIRRLIHRRKTALGLEFESRSSTRRKKTRRALSLVRNPP